MIAMMLLGAAGLTGCGIRTETFDVDIHNATTHPVTISLAKEAVEGKQAGPYEVTWASPEDIAMQSPHDREWWDRETVPPGHDAWVHHLTGKFNPDTRAMLRCYWGNVKISEMLARGRGSFDRIDVPLTPGRNDVTVVDRDGRMAAEVEQNVPQAVPK